MSNGLKVGLLVVIAAALAFLGYSQLKKGPEDVTTRPVPTASEAGNKNSASAHNHNASDPNASGQASQNRAKTSLKFDKVEHDFGTIKQGDSVECVFKVTNTGNEPLVLENAQGSCGCTVPDYPKDPIAPGDTRDIKVKFNSAGKKDSQSKTVTITANTEPIQSVLTIKSFVKAEEGK